MHIIIYLGEYAFPEYATTAQDQEEAIEMAQAHALMSQNPIRGELTSKNNDVIQLYTKTQESFYSYLIIPETHYSHWSRK